VSTESKNPSTADLPHSRNFSFRAPADLRQAIKHAAKHRKQSQSDFIADAVDNFLAKVDKANSLDDIQLPENFAIPKEKSKMMTIRIAPEIIDTVQLRAPRLYHSATRLVLWAVALRLYELASAKKSD